MIYNLPFLEICKINITHFGCPFKIKAIAINIFVFHPSSLLQSISQITIASLYNKNFIRWIQIVPFFISLHIHLAILIPSFIFFRRFVFVRVIFFLLLANMFFIVLSRHLFFSIIIHRFHMY